jgi:hypothetical protein
MGRRTRAWCNASGGAVSETRGASTGWMREGLISEERAGRGRCVQAHLPFGRPGASLGERVWIFGKGIGYPTATLDCSDVDIGQMETLNTCSRTGAPVLLGWNAGKVQEHMP